jgi:hypothetical protein
VGKFLRLGDVLAAIPQVDKPDAVVDRQSDPALSAAMDMCRPQNWHGTGAAHDLLAVAQDEGIPLSWAPPGAVIRRLGAAKSAPEREDVLLEERPTILAACAATIDDCTASEIADSRMLVSKAVAAVRAGYDEAGMALAVSVGEVLAHWAVEPRVKAFVSRREQDEWRAQWESKRSPYRRVDLVAIPANDVEPWVFIHQVLIAPIGHFFAEFRRGDAKPTIMSRHVVAHSPSPDHMTPLNALKAVMLVAGILRTQQEWIIDVSDQDH